MRELLFKQELVASAPDDFQLFENSLAHNRGEPTRSYEWQNPN
jgi:hypothetical protein